MRPRTKAHVEIVQLAEYVKDLEHDKDFIDWAFKNCLEHKGFATKNKVLCLDCGETFSPTLVSRNKATCPSCKTKILVIKSTRCTTDKQTNWFATAEIVGEYQVIRNFELIAKYKKGEPVNHYLHEILQYWVTPGKKMVMFGKAHNLTSYCDSWGGSMEIREENRKAWQTQKYDVYARMYYPKSIFKAEYSKYGINCDLQGVSFLEAIKILPHNPKAETLLKAKQYSMLGYYASTFSFSRYWDSIKICLRNNYKVDDASMYYDYLKLLDYFKKDLHNAFYVCPKNMKKEHDRLSNKKREIIRLQEIERDKQKIIQRQKNLEKAMKEYIENNEQFLGLKFTAGKISIQLLQSVDEFKQEGDELQLCLYTNEYYLKKDKLIFSARVDDKRTETIELNLTNFKIDQARGLKNNPTKYHGKIIKLLNKNLPKIQEIVKQKAS